MNLSNLNWIYSLQSIATSPELYPDLVSAGAIPTILSVLHHDNGDIAACAIELLAELTDADAVEDSVRMKIRHNNTAASCYLSCIFFMYVCIVVFHNYCLLLRVARGGWSAGRLPSEQWSP